MTSLLLMSVAFGASVELNPGDDVGALTSSLSAGDEIVFNAGTYELEAGISWSEALGTEASPIVFRAAEGAEVVLELIAASGRIATLSASEYVEFRGITFRGGEGWEEFGHSALELNGSNYVTVDGCTFEDINGLALYIPNDSTGMTITNNEILSTNRYSAIYAGASDASGWMSDSDISGNLIHDLEGTDTYAIYIDHGGQGNTIRDNVIFNVGHRGILVRSTEYGPENVVEGNAIWGVASLGIYIQGAATVRNNVVFNIDGGGVLAENTGRDTLEKVVISHNTVANTTGWGLRVDDFQEREGMVVANNVVSNPTGYAFHVDVGEIDDDNYVSTNYLTGLVEGLEYLKGHFEPGAGHSDFVDADGFDFYPSSNSTLVGVADAAGSANVPAIDFNGAERDGAAPDVGAYERIGDDNPGWALQEGFKEVGVDTQNQEESVGGCCGKEEESDLGDTALFLPLMLIGWRLRRRD